jgi:hypothetical protein
MFCGLLGNSDARLHLVDHVETSTSYPDSGLVAVGARYLSSICKPNTSTCFTQEHLNFDLKVSFIVRNYVD